MKKLSTILLGTLLTFPSVQAEGMKCGAGKCGSSMSVEKTNSKLLNEILKKDGYMITISSDKPLVTGNNDIKVTLYRDKKEITDAKVKVKFFMPEMPGMPYMEYKEKLKLDGKAYKGVVNFSMNGTWQYHLKFKTSDEQVHKVRGSVNL
jgi:hypothetical protein